ncbi:MAG: hypothetical protein RLY16_1544 [Bacteroidota bacterium]|jgi:hypothetical protein
MKLIISLLLFNLFSIATQNDSEWKTYEIFSMKLSLPATFKAGTKNEYNTYSFPNTISSSIVLNVECLIATAKFTPASLTSYHDDYLPEFKTITQDVINDSVFVLGGVDKNGKAFHVKGVKKDHSFFGLTIKYSPKYQYVFNENLSKILESFK